MKQALLQSVALLPAVAWAAFEVTPALAQVVPQGGVACSGTIGTFACSTNGTNATQLPALVNVFNNQGRQTEVTGTISGNLTSIGGAAHANPYVVRYVGQGTTNNAYNAQEQAPYQRGANIDLTNFATINWNNVFGAGDSGAIVVQSIGATGTDQGTRNYNSNIRPAYNGGTGGAVSINHAGSITMSGLLNYTQPDSLRMLGGIFALSQGGEGNSYNSHNNCCVGDGGAGGSVSVKTQAQSSITLNGPLGVGMPVAGIVALSLGGQGSQRTVAGTAIGGWGGNAGSVRVDHGGSIRNNIGGAGIVAASVGGAGMTTGGAETNAGSGGAVDVLLRPTAQVTVTGSVPALGAVGVAAISSAGATTQNVPDFIPGGGNVSVRLEKGSQVSASGLGKFNIGVLAVSSGTASILQPYTSLDGVTASGTGTSGNVAVTNDGSIRASGNSAIGIAGLSVDGAGIIAHTTSQDGLSYLGNSGESGYRAGGADVSIVNNGSIVTGGTSAHGILAASSGGGGILSTDLLPVNSGGNWTSGVILGASTPSGSMGQNAGAVSVTNTGSIATGDLSGNGLVAMGIVAQSIGGGGGSFAGNGAAAFVGDGGGGGGNGGRVTVNNSGQIATYSSGALGILAQSIGGGGGNGANAAGVFVAAGGRGGNGGHADLVQVTNTGSIVTAGDFAGGVIAQSVGGGGGNGGYATSFGLFVNVTTGGSGGSGGYGGTVLASNAGAGLGSGIYTSGQHSIGLLAQSIGGGGGSGGAAHGYEAGIIYSINMAVGGSGGGIAGAECGTTGSQCGGDVAINNVSRIATIGADSMGIVAQSIGGGGGTGAASVAKSLAVSLPDVPTFAFTASAGGKGGAGGDGGAVMIRNASTISTAGDGGHALLAQSVGGGGGNAGDSTAATYSIATSDSSQVAVAVALGATGGGGGDGGNVTVANGASVPGSLSTGLPASVPGGFFTDCPGCSSTIATSGDNAAALVAQSIGGGGGNATAGNASNNNPLGSYSGDIYSFDVSLGASGGVGGIGGTVKVDVDAGTTIFTTGSQAPGIIAQSIGGGGGTSMGGSFGMDVSSVSATIALGGNGVAGGHGGDVTVSNAGSITTTRGDSIGILAQSIGGGGGLAGSNDASGSVSRVNQIEDTANPPTGSSYSAEVAIGGTGGGGGNGGVVTVTNRGAISTGGERAYGIEAQSIGGGGGNAGSATATATSPTDDNPVAGVAIGGSGGVAGSGNTVAVASSGAITTRGYNAHGILAQSIGGGGGVGGDGSVSADTRIRLGYGRAGGAGGNGDGGLLDVKTNTGGTIATTGNDALGILAQSIGGGGGTGAAGCGNSCLTSTGTLASAYAGMSSDYSFDLGGGLSSGGRGGAIGISIGDTLFTSGARSMGIVAQSIGGGGGFAPAAAQNVAGITFAESNSSAGGNVNLTLQWGATVATTGAGAWGILAQSIGGGGGFAGDSSLNLVMPVSNTAKPSLGPAAHGGAINVNLAGNVFTSGRNAHGLIAQSVGGGGGFAGGGQLNANATLSSVAASSTTFTGAGGAIAVDQSTRSNILATGIGSIGILAQSTGGAAPVNPISLSIAGRVIGGTNTGYDFSNGGVGAAGILLSGGGQAPAYANKVDVKAGGFVGTMDGVNGTAITGNYGLTNLSNSGTITGSINLPYGSSTIVNNSGGVINSGTTISASAMTNSGTMNVFGQGTIGTTSLTGQFTQTSGGNLAVDVNPHAAQKADLLQISGSASLSGSVTPFMTALRPGTVTILTATQGITGNVTVPSSLLFQWNTSINPIAGGGSALSITPTANFHPQGHSLSGSQGNIAAYLASAWKNGDASFANLFAYLSQVGSASGYGAVLNAYSPKATQAQGHALINGIGTTLGASMSCPVFVDQSVMLGEDNCVWSKITGQQTSQWANGDSQGYQVSGVTYRLGGQHQIAPNWYLGGTFGITQSRATIDGGSSGTGQSYDGSVALKYSAGPWLFAGSVAMGTSNFQNSRVVNLPAAGSFAGFNASLQSNQNVFLLGGRLRGAYEFGFGNWYLRPYGDIDLIYTRAPGFQESGGNFALNIYDSSKTTVALSPMVEFGGRITVDEKTVLRPYVTVGARFLPDNVHQVDASLVGAQGSTGTFRTFSEMPQWLGSVDLGLQLYRAGGFEAKLEYGIKAGSYYFSQSGGGRIAYHF